MNKVLFCAFLLTVLTVNIQSFPRTWKLFPTRIVGGTVAPLGSVPHQITLMYSGSHICGGSIVTPNTILTAAHCVIGVSFEFFSVRAGLNDLKNPEAGYQEADASSVIIHENYDDFTLENDIAIIKLSKSLVLDTGNETRTGAILLPPPGHSATGNGTITGWGSTGEGQGGSDVLRTVTVPIVSDDVCRRAYGKNEITDEMICAGLEVGGKDSCYGDSGGPMLEDGTGYQVGIVSWGIGCAEPGYPGVYTEVSYFYDWIVSKV